MTEYEQIPGQARPADEGAENVPEPPAADAGVGDAPAQAPDAAPGAESAWGEVVDSLDDLGKAVADWARSVKDDPRNRERAAELKSGLEGIGRQLGDMIDSASKSDIGQQIGDVASKTGDAVVDVAKTVGDTVGPHVAGAFRSIADALRGAADRMPQSREGADVPPAPEAAPAPPPAPPAPPSEPED